MSEIAESEQQSLILYLFKNEQIDYKNTTLAMFTMCIVFACHINYKTLGLSSTKTMYNFSLVRFFLSLFLSVLIDIGVEGVKNIK